MNRLRKLLLNDERPLWMGIVNVTPDSFSDGGSGNDVERAAALVAAGADIIDIGGESTRPGAPEVTAEEEIARVMPVLQKLRENFPELCISIDTRKSAVARACCAAGADAINDVSMLRYSPDMACTAAETGAFLIIMHSRGTPLDMREARFTAYPAGVVAEVCSELRAATAQAKAAGVAKELIAVDPGLGFAKTPEQDLKLLGALPELGKIAPVLVGHSRKSFLGKCLGIDDPAERGGATTGISLFAALRGADMIRLHDVASSRSALQAYRLAADIAATDFNLCRGIGK